MKSLTHTPLPNKKDIIREQGSVRKTASVSTRPLPAVPYGQNALVLGTSGNTIAPADSAMGVSSHWSPARIRTKPIVHNATHTGLADNRGHSGLHWGQIGGAFAPTSRTHTLPGLLADSTSGSDGGETREPITTSLNGRTRSRIRAVG
ncbi:hypothetical protein E1301_Tti008607 [Triplophysa tibetana]|uniref:Uncharacterized protein n=1 Tax=Triplophysa tibetana TaxID=1572043 RepID=A0A5A9NSZ0_9TELE|nr:hypothetical protein E1301_Tti008607 [Triplophysa tibetana]